MSKSILDMLLSWTPKIDRFLLILGKDKRKMIEWLGSNANIYIDTNIYDSFRLVKHNIHLYFICSDIITSDMIDNTLKLIDDENVNNYKITYIITDNCVTINALFILQNRISNNFTRISYI